MATLCPGDGPMWSWAIPGPETETGAFPPGRGLISLGITHRLVLDEQAWEWKRVDDRRVHLGSGHRRRWMRSSGIGGGARGGCEIRVESALGSGGLPRGHGGRKEIGRAGGEPGTGAGGAAAVPCGRGSLSGPASGIGRGGLPRPGSGGVARTGSELQSCRGIGAVDPHVGSITVPKGGRRSMGVGRSVGLLGAPRSPRKVGGMGSGRHGVSRSTKTGRLERVPAIRLRSPDTEANITRLVCPLKLPAREVAPSAMRTRCMFSAENSITSN